MNKMDDLLYESGLTAQGCWDELDNYAKECIIKFGQLIVEECASLAYDGPAGILEHFGIEQMKELVINKCHGGFGLSYEAVMRYAELKGIKLYAKEDHSFYHYYTIPVDEFEKLRKESSKTKNWSGINDVFFFEGRIDRDDPALIQVVKEMGDAASGECAQLRIVQIPADVQYEIEDYDGFETVAEVHRTWG